MIIDQIYNIKKYQSIDKNLKKGLEFLQKNNFKNVRDGVYELSGKNLFYIINNYETLSIKDCKLEGHRQYIDIQAIISGDEIIGYAPLSNQIVTDEYKKEKDYALFKGEVSLIKMIPGMFAIFYLNDLHMSGILNTKKGKKVGY